MPEARYEVIVSQSANQSKNVAVANAASYLSYADMSNTIQPYGAVTDVAIYGGDGSDESYGIGLHLSVPVGRQSQKERFERELSRLSRVETFEEIS